MKIERPKRSRFMGHDYEVSFQPAGTINVDGQEAYGSTDHSSRRIAVEDNLPHDKEREVVLHETIHQILSTANANLKEDVEEHVCTLLGAALIGHIRDNPAYWRYILKKPTKT